MLDEVVLAADRRSLLPDEHFTVDGALFEAAASLKSVKPRDADPPLDDGDRGNPLVDGAQRSRSITHDASSQRDGTPDLLRIPGAG